MWMGHHMKTSLDHSWLILELFNHFQWRLHLAQPFSNFTAHYHIAVTPQLPNLKPQHPLANFVNWIFHYWAHRPASTSQQQGGVKKLLRHLVSISNLECQEVTWSEDKPENGNLLLTLPHVLWAIALHGKVTHHWLQVTCVSHCFICQSKNVGKYL